MRTAHLSAITLLTLGLAGGPTTSAAEGPPKCAVGTSFTTERGNPYCFESSITPIPYPKTPSAGQAALRRTIDAENAEIRADALECKKFVAESADEGGVSDGSRFSSAEVVKDTSTLFVVAVSQEAWCAGAHGSGGPVYFTFDATTGKAYDVRQLVNVDDEQFNRLMLDAMVAALEPTDTDCLRVVREFFQEQKIYSGKQLLLKPEGVEVWTDGSPYSMRACFDVPTFGYKKLAPFINAAEAARLKWPPAADAAK